MSLVQNGKNELASNDGFSQNVRNFANVLLELFVKLQKVIIVILNDRLAILKYHNNRYHGS